VSVVVVVVVIVVVKLDSFSSSIELLEGFIEFSSSSVSIWERLKKKLRNPKNN
jgi:hypothetical protein